jgi:hypothetical protein
MGKLDMDCMSVTSMGEAVSEVIVHTAAVSCIAEPTPENTFADQSRR